MANTVTYKVPGATYTLKPAPQVSVSKQYIRTGDGKKVGVTYSVELSGTIVPNRAVVGGAAQTPASAFEGLLNNAKDLREAFSKDGGRLTIEASTTKIVGHARVISLAFPQNQYTSTLPYTISLELDDIGDGSNDGVYDDIKVQLNLKEPTSGEGTLVTIPYISAATDTWQIAEANQLKSFVSISGSSVFVDNSNVYTLTHTISATGKRAYGGDLDGDDDDLCDLIRPPWRNAELFCLSRLGIPDSEDDTDPTGVAKLFSNHNITIDTDGTSSSGYGVFNYTRNQDVSQTEGTFQITETYLLVKKTAAADATAVGNTIEQINVDLSVDINSPGDFSSSTDSPDGLHTVTVNGTINGLETRAIGETAITTSSGTDTYTSHSYTSVTQTKIQAAEAEFDIKFTDSNLLLIAKGLSEIDGATVPGWNGSAIETLKSTPVSKTFSKNNSTGVITFTAVFNNRPQKVDGTISETGSFQRTLPSKKYAIIEVPNRAAGPVVQDLGTQTMMQETAQVSIVFAPGFRQQNSKFTENISGSDTAVSDANFFDIAGVPTSAKMRGVNHAGFTVIVTQDNTSYDRGTGTYSRTKTIQYVQSCS